MYTPDTINIAEEQVRQWHQQAQVWPSNQEATRGGSVRVSFISRFKNSVLRRAHGIENGTHVPAVRLLEAVARGELSPKAAQRLLQSHVSTLGLLQAVAWGEISPGAAQHVLAAPQR
jgi:hypothetical protein